VSSIRYREPAMLALIVLAAGWLSEKWGNLEARSSNHGASAKH